MTGTVYFLKSEAGPIKVGYSSNFRQRLSGIQAGSAKPLDVIGTVNGSRAFERHLHDLMAEDRQGGEWFADTQLVRSVIEGALAGETFGFEKSESKQLSESALTSTRCARFIKRCAEFCGAPKITAGNPLLKEWGVTGGKIWNFAYRPNEVKKADYHELLTATITAATAVRAQLDAEIKWAQSLIDRDRYLNVQARVMGEQVRDLENKMRELGIEPPKWHEEFPDAHSVRSAEALIDADLAEQEGQ